MDLKPPEQLLQDMLGISQTFIDLHGGQWKYGIGQPWDPERTKGYRGTSCATDPDSLQYKMSVDGPPVNDPEAAMANIKEYFTKRDFRVSNRFKSEFKGDWYIVFSMINDEGASFVYQPGTHGTQIVVESGCSTDPTMNDVTE
ncbi:hypothetical protein [Arthrobacter monumenti]